MYIAQCIVESITLFVLLIVMVIYDVFSNLRLGIISWWTGREVTYSGGI